MKEFIIYNHLGEIVQTGTVVEHMLHLQANASVNRFLLEGRADIHTQYVDVKTRELRTFTEAELHIKRNIPKGWVWLMPDRKALDMRTKEQKLADLEASFLASRSRAYPPLTEFADAMYWMSRGDQTKMNAYLEACDKVKQDFPKPNMA